MEPQADDAGPTGTFIIDTERYMKSILDPGFCYTSSLHTDVRKTFNRVRRELQRESTANASGTERSSNVLSMPSGPQTFAARKRA